MISTKKRKVFKIIGLLTGSLSILSTPIIATSCNTQNTNSSGDQNTIENNSIIKNSFDVQASFPTIAGNNGTKSEIQNNLNLIANDNKSLLIKNFDSFTEDEKNKASISVKVLEGDDNYWGDEEYSTWAKKTLPSNIIGWKGSKKTKDENEKIDFKSINQLKDFLSKNLIQIATNSGIVLKENEKIELANCKISFDNNNDKLLIGLLTNMHNNSDNSVHFDSNRFILSIPQNNLIATIPINVYIKIGNNEEEKNINFNSDFQTIVESKELSSFKDLNIVKNTISPLNNPLLLLSDYEIIKALGWTNDKGDWYILNDKWVDTRSLVIEKIKSDLNLKESDNIFGLKIYVKDRNINSIPFEGYYHFDINVSTKTNNDQRTEYKRYSYYKKLADKESDESLFKVIVKNKDQEQTS